MKLTTLPIYHNTPDHRLPIYCFLLYNSYLITCSQNQISFYFQRNINGIKIDLELHQTMNIPGNILCHEVSNDLLYFAGDSSILYVVKYLETKKSFECVFQIPLGRLDIKCMKIFNKYLITGGVDGILNIIDNNTLKLVNQININELLNQLNIKRGNKLIDENIIYGLNLFNDNLVVFTVNRLFVFNNEFRLVFHKGDIFMGLNNELYFSKSSVADEDNYLIVPLCFMEGEHVVEILNKNFDTVFSICGHIKTIECVAASKKVINTKYIEKKEKYPERKEVCVEDSFNETFETSFLSTDSERKVLENNNKEELLIATASQDKTLCIWSTASDKPLLVLKNFTLLPVMHMEFIDTVLICSSYDGYVKRLVFDEYSLSPEGLQEKGKCIFKNLELIGITEMLPAKELKTRNEIEKIKHQNEEIKHQGNETEKSKGEEARKSKERIEEEWKGLEEIFRPFSFEGVSDIPEPESLSKQNNTGPQEETHKQELSNNQEVINKESIKESIKEEIKEKQKFKIISPIEETPKIYKTKKNTFFAIFKNSPPKIKEHEIETSSKYTKQSKEEDIDMLEFKDFHIKPLKENLKIFFKGKELYTLKTNYKLLCFNLKYLIVYKEVLKIYDIKTSSLLFPFMIFQKIFTLDILKDELLILLYDFINILNLKTGKIIKRISLPPGLLINCQFDTIHYLLITLKEEGTFYFNKKRGTWNSLNSTTSNIFSEKIYFETSEDFSGLKDTFDSLEYEFLKNLDLLKLQNNFFKRIFLFKSLKKGVLKFVNLIYRDSVLEIKLEGFVKELVKVGKRCGVFREVVDLIAEVCDVLEEKGLKESARGIWALVE